ERKKKGWSVGGEIIKSDARGFSFSVSREKPKRRDESLQERLVRALRTALTSETTFFAVPDSAAGSRHEAAILSGQGLRPGVPDLIFISKGRAFGLELADEKARLSDAQRAAQLALRDAGMRVEVARSLDEALGHLRDMGIPLRLSGNGRFEKGRGA